MNYAKCFIVVAGAWLPALGGFAQDVLTKRNGDELQVKVTKVSADEVEYKKWANPDGPSYVVPKAEVFMIKYQNGDKDVFDPAPAAKPAEAPAAPSAPVKATPAADNAALIEEFNRVNEALFAAQKANRKGKKACEWIGTIAVTKGSVLSSDEIQVSFFNEEKSSYDTPYDYKGEASGVNDFNEKFCVKILNKTSQTLYIDKANSFRIEPDGNYHVYYNAQQTTVNQGGATGGGVNLGAVTGALGIGGVVNTLAGGVSVGGKSDHAVSTTYADQRVVAIPPHGTMVLSKDEDILIQEGGFLSGNTHKMISFSEDFKNASIPQLQKGEYKAFDETSSPATKRYMLTYSADPEFKSAKQLEFSLYVKEVAGVGTKIKPEIWTTLDKALEKLSGQKDFSTKSILVGNLF